MSRLPISTIKTTFQTGDRPSQTDYENLIDTTAAQATDLGTAGNNENTISDIQNATVIDNFDATVRRMVKYLVSIKKTSAGDNKFYATELISLIHQRLTSQISSVVLVPMHSVNSFGSLFTIDSGFDEILQSAATVNDVEIVDALTPTVLRQIR